MRLSRLLARWEVVTAIDIQVQRTDGGGAAGPHTISVAAGTYYVLDNGGADCILEEIEDAVQAAHANYSNFEVHVGTDGRIYFEAGANEVIVITFTGGALTGGDLRDDLRFSGAAVATPGTATNNEVYADRVHYGGLYLTRTISGDLPAVEWRRMKARQDNGGKEIHWYPQIERRNVRILYGGPPRGAGLGATETRRLEWWSVEDWAEEIAGPEVPFRWYMQDETESWITNAWDRITEPYGYQEWTHDAPDNWRPKLYRPGLYTLFRDELTWQEFVE